MNTVNYSKPLAAHFAWSCFLGSVFTLGWACAQADQNQALVHDAFAPDQLHYYNPLQHSAKVKRSSYTNASGLSNTQLETMAANIRDQSMSTQQRVLNQQWLEQEDVNGKNQRVGGRALSYILRMGFRTYWDGFHDRHYSESKLVPDSDGKMNIDSEVKYRLRVSDDDLRLMVKYDF